MNKTLIVSLVLLVLFGGWYFLVNQQEETVIPEEEKNTKVKSDPLNTTYTIDEEFYTLVNGSVEKEIMPRSATKTKVSVFGEPAFGDIDGDGDDDAVLILVNESGGSGTFYYAAIAANINGEYEGTDAILLGDRIAPQTFYVEGNKAVINYVDRNPGEDFSVRPSIGKSIYLQFDPEKLRLIQVAVDFEGEANPDVMTLNMKTWTWVKTTYNNSTEIVPTQTGAFTLTFEDRRFSATTDCNSISGDYEVKDKEIKFADITTTLMFCEESEEQEFSSMLSEVSSYFFTNRGELIFDLKSDSGSAIFR